MTTAYGSGNVPEIQVRHRLRIAREHAGLEQKQLAELIGVSRNTVGNAETGVVSPRRITLNAWALACGVPVSWLIDGNVSPGPSDGDGGGLPADAPEGTAAAQSPNQRVARVYPMSPAYIEPMRRAG